VRRHGLRLCFNGALPIIAGVDDVASLAWKWHKPLSARLQPVKGKKAGDSTEFQDEYLFNTTLHGLP
jgi:uncharacterized protein (UPF0210 family)